MKINNNKNKYNILLLEDSTNDAELIIERLRSDGLRFDITVVDNGDAYKEALDETHPDIILSDYHLPLFDGAFALAIAREQYPDIPFIFVTGAIGEDKAVDTLKKGASDFVLKDNLARLSPAVTRVLYEKKIIHERRMLYTALKENEERYRSLMENLPVGIFRTTLTSPGKFLQVNTSLAKMFGFETAEDLLKIPPANLYDDSLERRILIKDILDKGFVKGREIKFKTLNGESIWCSITATRHLDFNGHPDWIEGMLEDITDKKRSFENMKENYQLLETLINTINNPVFYKDINGIYLGCNSAFSEKIIGLLPEKIIGKTVFELSDAIPRELNKTA